MLVGSPLSAPCSVCYGNTELIIITHQVFFAGLKILDSDYEITRTVDKAPTQLQSGSLNLWCQMATVAHRDAVVGSFLKFP